MTRIKTLLFGATATHSSYRADIDGLRAIAVLSVVFFHDGLKFPGGYVGVDVFFVISGYLITGLILKDLAIGKFRLTEFWIRRVRRIFPAFFVVVLASLVAGAVLLFPVDFRSFGQSVMAQVVLASNFYFLVHSGYFAVTTDLMPLLHTWSLAVEEQFYLFFPLCLILCKGASRLQLIYGSILVAFASLLLSVYCSYYYPEANFYLLPTRAWELLLGGLGAMLPACTMPRWWRECLSWAGLGGIGFAVTFYSRQTPFPGLSAIPPCLGSAVLIWANSGAGTKAGKLLSSFPMVFIGLISYSLYLWHWPLIIFTKYWTFGSPSLLQRLIILAASIGLATVSWKWIETPIRRRTWLRDNFGLLAAAGSAAALLLTAGVVINIANGFPSRFSPAVLAYLHGAEDTGVKPQLSMADAVAGRFFRIGDTKTETAPQVVVWGDSHAMAILPVIDELCREHKVGGLAATHTSTPPLPGYTGLSGMSWQNAPYNEAILRHIQTEKIHDVILAAMWGNYGENARQTNDCVLSTVRALKLSGSRVWIFRQVPIPNLDVPRTLARYEVLGGKLGAERKFPDTYWKSVLKLEDSLFAGSTAAGAMTLDPTALLSDAHGQVLTEENSVPLYSDGVHISVTGAMKLRPLFEPVFDN